jgi:hypothetical protein
VNWTPRESSRAWYGVSISSTGLYQTAVHYSGQIYTSSDYGVNWTARDSARNWSNVSISSTGLYQTAVPWPGQIYTSSDYGVNWTPRETSRSWQAIAISSTGLYQTACPYGDRIYTSSDYGVNWTPRENSRSWYSVSMSSSGQYQTAGSYANISISTDYGVNWNFKSITNLACTGVSVSSDASYQTVVVQSSRIYTSSTFNEVATNYYTFNLDNGSTFFLTGEVPTANYTANFTISALNTSRTYLIMLINNTSSAASYYCTSITINGTSISTIYNVSPTLTSAVVTCQEISLFYNSTSSAWQADSLVKNYQAA